MKVENHRVMIISEPNNKGEVEAIFYTEDSQRQRLVNVTELQPETAEDKETCLNLLAIIVHEAANEITKGKSYATSEIAEIMKRAANAYAYLSDRTIFQLKRAAKRS